MPEFELFFYDLNEDAQNRLLEAMNLEEEENGNFDISPIAVLEFTEDD